MNHTTEENIIYALLAITFLTWVGLALIAWLSFRWSRCSPPVRRKASLILAVIPILLGTLFLISGVELTGEDNRFVLQLGWLFLLPVVLGLVALGAWFGIWRKWQHAA